ncbi:hypothetical protein SAMN05421493_1034 [Pseudobutyrivibrio sp. 49]|uniref:hypothetical protein n=1 Tax=Pseudobutyrivibrio sp. 49 TaxID=1855344 RepID=UPI0008842F5F|nr:hypothetical protein [Pseudobutyrivibrio sp. 49]SDH67229.1 hypothetical protein SAMN05421493_1034 [Pseudobutyrivibrio sp. 49]
MEKMEYRNIIEEMKNLVSKNKFADAMAVADTINWRKVHNINDLIAGSESYEAAGKIDEARDLLLLAHERSPIGRMILYKLCMISIKLKELDEAQEYYNEFVQIAPHDSLKYILKYNINTAKGADTATLITILEQLKESDFIEEWAYELAYLYHKTNQADKCISLCDEIILWFGDGPVVERALELKMLYQPLDKAQEDKYRSLQQKKDGIVEITSKPVAESSEILPAIADIKLPEGPERFDTINLQAEIKKNIDEIMKATDTGEVTENIDAIKTLVEEIPYLHVTEEAAPVEEETVTFSVNDTFQQYLEEGYDGQISLRLDDESTETEEQIEGQMTIDDVLAEWEKTKRAAEAAMEDAKEKELESARAKALREANNVLNRLEGAMSKLNSGMTSSDLLKEEYLANTNVTAVEEPVEEEVVESETAEETSGETVSFSVPKLDIDGLVQGTVDIPVIKAEGAALAATTAASTVGGIVQAADTVLGETTNWEPPTLDEGEEEEVDLKEASEMIADVNKMLQQEIDRLTNGEDVAVQEEPEFQAPEEEATEIQDAQINIDDIELPVIQIPEDLLAELPSASISESEVYPESEVYMDSEVEEDLPIISENVLEPQEIAELVDEKVLSNVIKEEVPDYNLDSEDLETFSYFLPISGMKESIVQVLTGAVGRIKQPELSGGNIIIVGEPGSGKTQMATSIIKVLEKKTGYPKGGIGKISGEKLNEKDIQKLYSKIQGGCLIIETAGDISKETAVTLSLLMEQDNTGTILIIEDNKRGIEKALAKDSSFAKRFTEKIVIPAFTIDELVSFARTYANEAGCSIDDMGVLALYNRINLIGRYNHATTIKEVAEIMDGAIEKSTRGGFFNKPKYDRDGNIILKEKDFD